MGVGPKIKEFRNKSGLTQKDLADQLHVTYQAVSRWENDDAEPSIDTIKEICNILNCSIEELFDMKKPEEEAKTEEKVSIVEKVIVQEQKPVLGVCEQCNKPIYEAFELNRINESYVVRKGKLRHTENRQKILCKKCNEARLLQEKQFKEKQKKEFEAKLKRRRIHSFIWPSLAALIFLFSGIYAFVEGDISGGFSCLLFGLLIYCFVATMILNNTFITEMWLEITSWGFVKMPGIIFEFSFNGVIVLIVMKIILFLIGILIALLAAAFATFIAMALSIFVYPYALIKNIKYKG